MAEFPAPGDRLATVFGGSGFLGRYIVRAFAQAGWRVRVAVRRPDLAGFLRTYGAVGQVEPVQANVRFPASLDAALEGAEVVVNATGIARESGRQRFESVHVHGAEAIARAARAAGARALTHISGLGADAHSANAYIASKGRGEEALRAAFPEATILRPSVVFGPEDAFFNRFADLARFLPVLPAFSGGAAKLQPVYVCDVALAAARALDGGLKPGATYELGGPEIMTLTEAMALALRFAERRRAIVPVPYAPSRWIAQATEIASLVSFGLFPEVLTTTRDSVDLLRSDNVVSADAVAQGRDFAGLGIAPRGAEAILPLYLARYRKTGQFASNRFA
ncbi:MAG: complex I NDUFA9 subunit family protein [Pseudomonadota bacterium]|nr:complex I NDUFA9 subunit family protein [Pseudomonadota bacterium]